jgi:hypothetical protein
MVGHLTLIFSNFTDYSSDLRSYLKYCKEVIFTGITVSKEKEHLIEIFSDMYNAREVCTLLDNVVTYFPFT